MGGLRGFLRESVEADGAAIVAFLTNLEKLAWESMNQLRHGPWREQGCSNPFGMASNG
jgi:hypothetical protein